MDTILVVAAVLAIATFAPEIFEKLTTLFKFTVQKLKSLWDSHA
jgi:hypothetical protein